MKILDKIEIYDKEYACIQKLYIDDKTIYKLYNVETEDIKFIENNTRKIITDKKVLEKINKLTHPKTDIIEKSKVKKI